MLGNRLPPHYRRRQQVRLYGRVERRSILSNVMQRILVPTVSVEEPSPIFLPECSPMMTGDMEEAGEDWFCQCDASIAKSVHPRQLLNMYIRCPRCGIYLETPRLEAGTPIPGTPIFFPSGRFLLGEALQVTSDKGPMIGPDALEQYDLETGKNRRASPLLNSRTLDESELRRMADLLEGALGERFTTLVASDARASKSPTPPDQRQRIVELIEFARSTANDFEADVPVNLNGQLLSELASLVHFLDRWQFHPAMPKLMETLAHQTEPQHTAMLLGMASMLADTGHGVGIYLGEAEGKIADLWVEVQLRERIELEIKVPLTLRSPKYPLSHDVAARVVQKSFKKANGQLKTGTTHMLAIGGFNISDSMEVLEVEARKLLHLQRTRKHQFVGMILLNMTFEVFRTRPGLPARITPKLETRVVTHRGYRGQFKIELG